MGYPMMPNPKNPSFAINGNCTTNHGIRGGKAEALVHNSGRGAERPALGSSRKARSGISWRYDRGRHAGQRPAPRLRGASIPACHSGIRAGVWLSECRRTPLAHWPRKDFWQQLVTAHSQTLLQLLLLIVSLGVLQVVFESLGDLFGIPPDIARVFVIILRPQMGSIFVEIRNCALSARRSLLE